MRRPEAGTIDLWLDRPRPGLVRDVLARYGVEADLVLGPHGKPALRTRALEFNLSHAGDVAAVAVSDRAVGVDVERMRHRTDPLAMARRWLSPGEARTLAELDGDERRAAFLWLWTAKEAYVKALGTGLRTPLRSFEVSGFAAGSPRVEATHDGGDPADWSLAALELPEGYAGAVAQPCSSGAMVKPASLSCSQ